MSSAKKAVRTVGFILAATLISKILGLLRLSFIANYYGTGIDTDAFLSASRIPMLFFDITLGAAVMATFIPIFSRYLKNDGEERAFAFANTFLNLVIILASVFCVLGMVFPQILTNVFAPGLESETMALALKLLVIMLPITVMTAIAFVFVGILHSLEEFFVPAIISVVSNLAVLAYLYFFNSRGGVHGLAIAVLVGWSLQVLVQVPMLIKKGYRYRFTLSLKEPGLRDVGKLALPVLISSWVQPICATISMHFGSYLATGAVASLDLANNLYIILVGVFSLAITNYIFPKLSRMSAGDDEKGFIDTVRTSIKAATIIVVPIMAGMMLMAKQIISVAYERGEFTSASTATTSTALYFFSIGMIAFSINEILSKSFYARKNGITPMVASLAGIIVNIVLGYLTVRYTSLGVGGLALAAAVAANVTAVILFVRMRYILNREIIVHFLKILAATTIMVIVVWVAKQAVIGRNKYIQLLIPTMMGALVYAGGLILLRVKEVHEMLVDGAVIAYRKMGEYYSESLICSLGKKIKKDWSESAVVRIFTKQDKAVETSLAGRVLLVPISLVRRIFRLPSDGSGLVKIAAIFLMNLIMLNSMLLGSMFLVAGLLKLQVAVIIVGLALILLNRPLLPWVKGSILTWIAEHIMEEELFRKNPFAEFVSKDTDMCPAWQAVVFGAICGAAMGLHFPYGIMAVIGAIGVMMVLKNPIIGVYAVAFSAAIFPTMVAVGISAITILAYVIHVSREKASWDGASLAVMIYELVLGFYTLASLIIWESVPVFVVYAIFVGMFFVVKGMLGTKERLFRFLALFGVGSLLVSLLGIYQNYFGNNYTHAWLDLSMFADGVRVYSTLDNPNVLGEFLLIAIPICAVLLWTRKQAIGKVFWLGVLGVNCVCMMLTQSRGCWIGLIIAAAIYIVFVNPKLIPLGIFGMLLLPFVLPDSIVARFTSIGNIGDSSTAYRLSIWSGTINMLKEQGLWGLGLGNTAFREIYQFYSYSAANALHAHNLYLQLLCEIGIVGLTVFLVAVTAVYLKMLTTKAREMKIVCAGIMAGVGGFLVQGVFDHAFYNYRIILIFWAVLAVGLAAARLGMPQKEEEAAPIAKKLKKKAALKKHIKKA